jgi:hypothetical protein
MKTTLLALLIVSPLTADITTITYDFTATAQQYCGSQAACAPLVFELPQFNNPQGTLTAVDWTLTDSIQYFGGINDMYETPGTPWTATFAAGDYSALLGLDQSTGYSESGIVYGNGTQISMGGWLTYGMVSASGAAPDIAPFVGDGTLQLAITPFANTSATGAYAGIIQMQDSINLAVTYVDPSPVPEPRWIGACGLALLVMGALLGQQRARRRRTIAS